MNNPNNRDTSHKIIYRPAYYAECSTLGRNIISNEIAELICNEELSTNDFFSKECLIIINLYVNDFSLGNALKYIWRLNKKNSSNSSNDSDNSLSSIMSRETEENTNLYNDLKKACFYLYEYINRQRILDQISPTWVNFLLLQVKKFLPNSDIIEIENNVLILHECYKQ